MTTHAASSRTPFARSPCGLVSQDKTRANAAGALGNLVRNSSALCADLIKASALKALLDTAMAPERPSSAKGAAGEWMPADGAAEMCLSHVHGHGTLPRNSMRKGSLDGLHGYLLFQCLSCRPNLRIRHDVCVCWRACRC